MFGIKVSRYDSWLLGAGWCPISLPGVENRPYDGGYGSRSAPPSPLLPAPLQSQTLRAPKRLHPASAPPISRTRIHLHFLPTPWGPCDAVAVAADVQGYSAPQLWFGLGPGGIIKLRMMMYMSWCIYLETMLDEIEACAGLIMSLDRQMVLLLSSCAAETCSHPITRGPKPYDSYEGEPSRDS